MTTRGTCATLVALSTALCPRVADADERPPAAADDARTTLFYDEPVDRFGWYTPDFARLKTGGFLGMFDVGVGYSIAHDIVNVGASYGLTPAYDGAPTFNAVGAELTLRPLHVRPAHTDLVVVPLYVGGGGIRTFGPNLFVSPPARYPHGYYAPNALHATVFVGVEAGLIDRGTLFRGHALFYEAVTIDEYLDPYVHGQTLSLTQAVSSAFGYRASF